MRQVIQSFKTGELVVEDVPSPVLRPRGILVRTGYGAREEQLPQAGVVADAIVNNLIEAAAWILRYAEPQSAT